MVLAIAHRGARSLAPENTLPAIKKAWELGADMVEIDVTATLDGHLVVLHDDLLVRTTDIRDRFPDRWRDPCSTFSLKEIQTLDAGSWFITRDPFGQIAAGKVSQTEILSFRGTPIPTLEEVLDFVDRQNWKINIEIKKMRPPLDNFPIAQAVLDLIGRMRIPVHRLVISSFDHKYIRHVQCSRSDIEINALIDGFGPETTYEFSIYNADASLTDEEQLAKAHDRGCQVNLYTVNDPKDMLRFIRAGAKGLFTDFPQTLVGLLKMPDL